MPNLSALLQKFQFVNLLNVKKTLKYLKKHGPKRLIHRINEKFCEIEDYPRWIRKNEPSKTELEAQRRRVFARAPKISIVVPVFNTPVRILDEMVDSVLRQTYQNWEICIADGNSDNERLKRALVAYAERDKRIKVKCLKTNKGIAGNSNEAAGLATGEFIALLDHDDTLAPFALYEVVSAVNRRPQADFIYSDEDKLTEDGKKRCDPHFKPEWSPDTLLSYNYIAHLTVLDKGLFDRAGGFREGYDGSQDYDLILRAGEKAKEIVHIPKVLYHWRFSRASTANDLNAKPYAFVSAKKALSEHLSRTGARGRVEDGIFLSSYRVRYDVPKDVLVSIIIPNSDHAGMLKTCVDSIIKKSTYSNYEILIIENHSKEEKTFEYYKALSGRKNVRVVTWDRPFNYSSVNNYGAGEAKGEVIVFLNNDTEILTPTWIEDMLEHALRRDVGAVGLKLYYPDGTIQHAGVILGIGGVAGHSHKYSVGESSGYIGRLHVIQNLTAVTAACLMTRKEVFNEVKGFDESYRLAFNDVDLCMKIRHKGLKIIWTPFAELIHHESKTRGFEDTPDKIERFNREVRLFQKKWKEDLEKGDPYYNPNLNIVRDDMSFRLNYGSKTLD